MLIVKANINERASLTRLFSTYNDHYVDGLWPVTPALGLNMQMDS